MSDLLSVTFNLMIHVFIALYQIDHHPNFLMPCDRKFSQIELFNRFDISNIVVFLFVYSARVPFNIEAQLSQKLLYLFDLPDDCLRGPLNTFSLFFDRHNPLIPVETPSAICQFVPLVVESECGYERLNVQCLFALYEPLSRSKTFRCVAREAFNNVFRVYCAALSNHSEFKTIAVEAHRFRRVAELVDVSTLNEARWSVLGENMHVCCFFVPFFTRKTRLRL
jgi:hypothetical protein